MSNAINVFRKNTKLDAFIFSQNNNNVCLNEVETKLIHQFTTLSVMLIVWVNELILEQTLFVANNITNGYRTKKGYNIATFYIILFLLFLEHFFMCLSLTFSKATIFIKFIKWGGDKSQTWSDSGGRKIIGHPLVFINIFSTLWYN